MSVWQLLIGSGMDSLVRLEGAEHDDIAVTADRLLMTMFRWHGARSLQSAADLQRTAQVLRDRLAPALAQPGHALQVGFLRDPAQARAEIGRSVASQEAAAERMQLDVSAIMRERRSRLPQALTGESMWIVVWSSPALAGPELKREMAEATAPFKGMPPMASAQVPGRVARTMVLRHRTLVDSLATDFAAAGQVLEKLSVEDAARVIRCLLGPHDLGELDAWTPRMPHAAHGDGGPAMKLSGILRFPEFRAAITRGDCSTTGVETLAEQVLDEHWNVTGSNTVRVGNRSYAGFDLALAPEMLIDFGRLVEIARHPLTERPLRWRCCWLLEAGGLAGNALRNFLLSVFTFLSRTHNVRIRDAFSDLHELDGADDQVIRLRASFAVWEDGLGDTETDRNQLDRQLGRLRRAVERWGNARTDRLFGDPCAGLVSSVPGAACASTAPSAAAPLLHAVALLPLDRPTSPWATGSLVLSSPDGRIWPWAPGSPEQVSWCDLLVGLPGSGKSSLLSAMNLAAVLAPSSSARFGAARLPEIGIIDIGHSSSGLIALLRDGLPPSRQGEAVHMKLSNHASSAINPCDTPPGCRHPPAALLTWLANFVGLLLLPDDGHQADGMEGLIRAAIEEAYVEKSDERRPTLWSPGESLEVDRALEQHGVTPDEHTSWWECADKLEAAGEHAAAAAAQRLAMPLLSSLVEASRAAHIETTYGKVTTATGETLLDKFARGIQAALGQWPLIAHPTRFSTGEARVVALDLAQVTSAGASIAERRSSALMYMLARQAITGSWWTDHAEIAADQNLPKAWRARHRQLQAESAGVPRRLCIDEFHRTGNLDGIRAQVDLDIRESRKHGIQLALASQHLSDFDQRLLDNATGVWVCSSDAAGAAQERLGLSERAAEIIRDRLHGPTSAGAPVFASLRLRDGPCRQLLVNRMGPVEIWAFSTTAEDVALRECLSEMLSPRRARALLAAAFPGGTAREKLEQAKTAVARRGEDDDAAGVIRSLALHLVARQGELLAADGSSS